MCVYPVIVGGYILSSRGTGTCSTFPFWELRSNSWNGDMAGRHPDTGWNVTHRCGLLARGLRLPLGSHAALLGRRARERRTKAEALNAAEAPEAAARRRIFSQSHPRPPYLLAISPEAAIYTRPRTLAACAALPLQPCTRVLRVRGQRRSVASERPRPWNGL